MDICSAEVTQPDGKSYGYRYDYRMRRVGTRSTVSGTDTHTAILFSGGLSTAEYESSTLQTTLDNAAAGLVHYVRGPDMGGGVGGLLYSLRSETGGVKKVRYNLSNGRGDIVAQSDINAALTWTASYEAYGKRTQETGTNTDKQRANSKDEDPTGLLNEGFRYRDIETGIWLSRDPAGFVDGPNLYAYVKQNPWTSWDPLGLEEENAGKTIVKAQQQKIDLARSLGQDDIADAQQGLLDNGKSMANSTAQAMDAAVSATPLGAANEAITGKNSMGESLSLDQRGMAVLSVVPVGKMADKITDIVGAAKKATDKADGIVDATLHSVNPGAKNGLNELGDATQEATRTFYVGAPARQTAIEAGENVLQLSVEALTALAHGDKTLAKAESIQWAQTAAGKVNVRFSPGVKIDQKTPSIFFDDELPILVTKPDVTINWVPVTKKP